MQKTFFITFFEPIIIRNIAYTDFWPEFLERNPDTRIVLLVRPDERELMTTLFATEERIVIEVFNGHKPSRFEQVFLSLARSGLRSNTNLWSKMRSYERGDSSWVATVFKRAHARMLGTQNWYKRLLRLIILQFKSNKDLVALFNTYKPDALLATSLSNYDYDVPVAREAKRRNIRLVGMIRSWDGLSSHGLVRVAPHAWLLQNKFLKSMAIEHQATNPKNTPIHVVGVQHYDLYIEKNELLESRESFFERMGLDPNKKYILYGAMGDFLFPHEGEIADVLEELITENKVFEPAQVLFRSHPKFTSPFERMQGMKHVLSDKGDSYTGTEPKTRADGRKGMRQLFNALYHADVVVTGGSTFAIDAAMLDKPIICIGFNGKTPESDVKYWHSVKRFYDTYTHFEALMATGGARLAQDKEQLAGFINDYLQDPSQDTEKRKAIVDLLAPFAEGSGKRLAKFATKELNS